MRIRAGFLASTCLLLAGAVVSAQVDTPERLSAQAAEYFDGQNNHSALECKPPWPGDVIAAIKKTDPVIAQDALNASEIDADEPRPPRETPSQKSSQSSRVPLYTYVGFFGGLILGGIAGAVVALLAGTPLLMLLSVPVGAAAGLTFGLGITEWIAGMIKKLKND